uniref:unspecific monooxygenase n=1 Tax=Helicoverpa armigera TaxID=29058 RepID=Q6RW46_HELAM|nr:cytochrome P450 [Helicoverpa armigera]
MIALLWLAVLVAALTLYLRQVYSRFSRFGVKHFEPVPLVGNLSTVLMRKAHASEDFNNLYQAFPGERFVGRYEFLRNIVMIRDLELVKSITVKDFEHFIDHRMLADADVEPLFGRNLFSLRGHEWKEMRSTLSPAFTSSKMKAMVPFMMEVSEQLINFLKMQIKESGGKHADIECKDLMTRYANDVIASCAFGLKVDSHNDRENEFYSIGTETANFDFKKMLVIFGYACFPAIMKKFNVKMFSELIVNFFKNIVIGTMRNRQKNNILRPDMIHLLMVAKKGKLTHEEKVAEANTGFATVEESDIGKVTVKKEWTEDDLTAQAVLFFVAGYETISSAMAFLIYELAVHPEVQEKLAKEIREHDAKNGGKFDFNSIQNMPYLDMVISEVLRLWPPAVGLDRECSKDYNLGKPNDKAEKDYILRKGEALVIPVWSIHHDPEYFPDPYKFDPERFSEENKHKIQPFSYMPFGLGPRNCIGSRFALCEVKVMAYQLIQQMELSPCEKTSIPAVLAKDTFNLKVEGGHYIRVKLRQ